MFSEKEWLQIQQQGIGIEAAMRQQKLVEHGKTNVEIIKPAMLGDGVFAVDKEQLQDSMAEYPTQIEGKKIVKFVPASGAATRMFQDLYAIMQTDSIDMATQTIPESVTTFFNHLSAFAFFELLKKELIKQPIPIELPVRLEDYPLVLRYLLTEQGLNYAKQAKGLLPFHRYHQHNRTAFEEHWVEAAGYACGEDRTAHVHFTVSAEHRNAFQSFSHQIHAMYEKQFGIHYHVDFSTQRAATDTIAFSLENKPVHDKDGNLVFRPGGHGSLIENLNTVDADVILIKNIDNVALDSYKSGAIDAKKLLISRLLSLQKHVFHFLAVFDNGLASQPAIAQAETFLQDHFFMSFSPTYILLSAAEKQDFLYRLLDRPLRVCGMVKRENEPGGAPFWTKDANGALSLQIVEASEIDLCLPEQRTHFENAPFFNPVDLVCSTKNHLGKPFDLTAFIDHSRYFISEKSHEGTTIKAIENPGLWNGAMSDWLTVFVAVPLSTFSPVKTVNDLLRKEHTGN
jgi:hypothetical protein